MKGGVTTEPGLEGQGLQSHCQTSVMARVQILSFSFRLTSPGGLIPSHGVESHLHAGDVES